MIRYRHRFLPAAAFFAVLTLFPGRSARTAPEGDFFPFYAITLNGVPCISMVELAESFRVDITYDPVTLTMTLSKGTQRLSASNLSRVARFNDASVPLGQPARLVRGAMYVPVPGILPLFSRLTGTTLTWDESRNGIIIPSHGYTVRAVTIEERAQGTLIRISLADSLAFSAEMTDRNWLTLTLAKGSLSPSTGISIPPKGMVLDSRFVQRTGDVQLSFRLDDSMGQYDISRPAGGNDLLVSIRKKRETAAAKPPDTPVKAIENLAGSPGTKQDAPFFNEDLWRIDTVIIDAGHGGKDSGAIGPKGTKEKDVVLAVAQELKKLIDERDELDAVMTRDSDTFITLYQRANIARRAEGKLFVSIHANASPNRTARGMEVFFLSAAKTDDAKRVAERENASVEMEDNPAASRRMLSGNGLLDEIEHDMATNVYLKESQDLCSVLLETTVPVTRQTNRGVKQAGFYVLAGTLSAMPSILFEVGFISNPEEETMLGRISYQKRLAQAIYDAIITFKVRHERGLFTKSE